MAMATPASHSLLVRVSSYSSTCFFSPSRCCGSPLSAAIPSYSSSLLYPNFSSADEVLFGRRYQHQHQQEQLWSRTWRSRAMSAAADVSAATSATTVVSHQSMCVPWWFWFWTFLKFCVSSFQFSYPAVAAAIAIVSVVDRSLPVLKCT
jgi:hypothetical protein